MVRGDLMSVHSSRGTIAAASLSKRLPWQGLSCILVLTLSIMTGCLSPIAMHRAVLEYDRTVHQVEAELLLLNIARARHYRPCPLYRCLQCCGDV